MKLKWRDFQTLRGRVCLSDRIIDEYMRLIWEINIADPSSLGIYVSMTYLYTRKILQGFEHKETRVKAD